MGSSLKSKSTRVRTTRSVHPASRSRRKTPVIPVQIGNAIEDQRRALVTAITLLHCLHTVLRRQTEDGGEDEPEAVQDALGWVELPDLTAMLLQRLHSVHLALDCVSLKQVTPVSKP
jgi:hypothetical protein